MRNDNPGRKGSPLTNGPVSRRDVLLTSALTGSSFVAGCLGGNDGDDGGQNERVNPEDVKGVHVEGQSLRIPIAQNPEEMHFLWGVGDFIESPYDMANLSVYPATHTQPIWARWLGPYPTTEDDPRYLQLYDSVEITEDTITVEIAEDANWSDGEPVTAYDAVAQRALWAAPREEHGWSPPPEETHVIGSAMDFTMPDGPDGKEYQFHVIDTPAWDEAGGFHHAYGDVLFWIGWTYTRLGPMWPAHVEPYKTIADVAVEQFEEKVDYEDALPRRELAQEYVSKDDLEAWRDGDTFVSHGAWTLDEVREAQDVVLEPNEYHPNADQINFDEVLLEYNAEPRRTRAGLESEHLDYATVNAPPEFVDSLPDSIEEHTTPANGGYTITLDHNTVFGEVEVRQAMMYALNTPDIAQNIHPTAADPIIAPGGDVWAADAAFDEEWLDENLVSYEQDLDAAEELMREAGFERNSDDIWQRDGEPIQTQLATNAETPVFETTAAEQLRDFGMDIEVQTYDDASYVDRWTGKETNDRLEEDQGRSDFDMWAGDWASDMPAGFYSGLESHWWSAYSRTMQLRARNVFPHEVQEDAAEEYGENGSVGGQYEHYYDFQIDLPPVGEPDGEPVSRRIPYLAGLMYVGGYSPSDDLPDLTEDTWNPPEGQEEEYYWQLMAWSHNYFLPVLPIALNLSQNFFNTENWHWPPDLEGEDNEYMWEYFGGNWDAKEVTGMGKVLADPDNPKDDAEVVDEE